jgi:hypothetical protein
LPPPIVELDFFTLKSQEILDYDDCRLYRSYVCVTKKINNEIPLVKKVYFHKSLQLALLSAFWSVICPNLSSQHFFKPCVQLNFIPCFNVNLAQSQFGDSAICAAVAVQQQYLSLQSEDSSVRRLQFTGSLTGKAQ